MRTPGLIVCCCMLATPLVAGRPAHNPVKAMVPQAASDGPSWAGETTPRADSDFGFAPLTVTQDGVAYTPAAPGVDPAGDGPSKIADLPAWASSRFSPAAEPRHAGPLGAFGFGALPEPTAWALILVGTAMICGALRGLIVANRRLARLRDDKEAD